MKHYIPFKSRLICLSFCFISLLTFAQESSSNQNNFWSRVEYGGGIGLNFSDGYFSGSLAPNALYRINPSFATGIGLNFSYASQKNMYKSTVLGGSIIGLFNPMPEIQVSTEFEQLHVSRKFDDGYFSNLEKNYWYPSLYFGAGYRTGNVTIGIRYDILYDEDKSIYTEPLMPYVRFRF